MTNALEQAGIHPEWAHSFVVESNLIDPQPGDNVPGYPIYDLHMQALLHAIQAGVDDRYALPRELHRMLLGDHPLAGMPRTQPISIGFRTMLHPRRVPHYTWRWNADAREVITALRKKEVLSLEESRGTVWDLHCELMNIRPFELYNGRVGRLLMVNHALLIGEMPLIIYSADRDEYVRLISRHPSAHWVDEPLYVPSAVRYREW
jgi:hypothetical protein